MNPPLLGIGWILSAAEAANSLTLTSNVGAAGSGAVPRTLAQQQPGVYRASARWWQLWDEGAAIVRDTRMPPYRKVTTSAAFRAWLSAQPSDRQYLRAAAGQCPLAAYSGALVSPHYVTSGGFDTYPLPGWAEAFVKEFDHSAPEVPNTILAILVLDSIINED